MADIGDEFLLRLGGVDDAAAIRQLTRAAYTKWISPTGREPTPMRADYDAAVREHRFDLLFRADGLVALIETIDETDQLLIENVAVAPALQGHGLGTRMMAVAEDIARSLGRRRIRLYTNKLWRENIELYIRLGYAVDSEVPIELGVVRVNMSKDLSR